MGLKSPARMVLQVFSLPNEIGISTSKKLTLIREQYCHSKFYLFGCFRYWNIVLSSEHISNAEPSIILKVIQLHNICFNLGHYEQRLSK
jgi:hypothetical protein